MTLEPTFRRVAMSTDKWELRVAFMSVNIGNFTEAITELIGGDTKIDLNDHGCMPLVVVVKNKSCVTHIKGANAPALLEAININIPPPPEEEEDEDA